jgi:hypothetical protein
MNWPWSFLLKMKVGQDESPSLQGQDIGVTNLYLEQKSGHPSFVSFGEGFLFPATCSRINEASLSRNFRIGYWYPLKCIPYGINKSGTAEVNPSVSIARDGRVF